jgi:erythronate-4-phosphate dehydrogenase
MKIIADENIPLAARTLEGFGAVEVVPAQAFTRTTVRNADVLLVRSVTRVGPELLDGASVRFVGSATIGTDHIDLPYLAARGIEFANAPGSNAESVVEYVLACLVYLSDVKGRSLSGLTAGVVGYGNIGSRLAPRLAELDLRILVNDPPLGRDNPGFADPYETCSLEELLRRSDIVTLHVPLDRNGAFPTWHLIGDQETKLMPRGAWLFNTSRGGVVEEEPLVRNRKEGLLGSLVLDVWENEPALSDEAHRVVDIGTPHIAGYSLEGKRRGMWMLYERLCEWDGRNPAEAVRTLLLTDDRLPLARPPDALEEAVWRRQLISQLYDPVVDDRAMRRLGGLSGSARERYFHRLRRDYPIRRSWGQFELNARGLGRQRARFARSVAGVRLCGL